MQTARRLQIRLLLPFFMLEQFTCEHCFHINRFLDYASVIQVLYSQNGLLISVTSWFIFFVQNLKFPETGLTVGV